MMLKNKMCFLVIFICLRLIHVGCIVSKSNSNNNLEKYHMIKSDQVAAPLIDRNYITGYEENYGDGGHGLSAHASHGLSEGLEEIGGSNDIKHHYGHYIEDHHHSHTSPPSHHHHHHHNHQSYHKHHDYHKALAIKGLLVPLAGVALLGAAAAFVSNPILLQLGVISSSALGRRKREIKDSIIFPEHQNRLNKIKLLEKFMAQIPKQEIKDQEEKILASYLSCSGITTTNLCLERLACELYSSKGILMPMEVNVLTIVINEILGNGFIPNGTKKRISKAAEIGKKNLGCYAYTCEVFEKNEKIIIDPGIKTAEDI